MKIPNWILGGTFAFSTKTNDPLNAKFYIFQIQSNGAYKLVQLRAESGVFARGRPGDGPPPTL